MTASRRTSNSNSHSGEIQLSNGHLHLDGREIKIGDRVAFAQSGFWLSARIEFDDGRNSYVAILDNGHVVKKLKGLRARWPEL